MKFTAPPPDWWPDWTGQTCIIVASGPSAQDVDLEIARGRAKVIAINNSWRLAPWADVLYGCDFSWWTHNKGVPSFRGLKMAADVGSSGRFPALRKVNVAAKTTDLFVDKAGHIGSGGNSGFQAINLAVQFGAARIVLVGYDMNLDRGAHWHGRHPPGMNNPKPHQVVAWRAAIDGIAPQLAAFGIEMVNASAQSALTAYPKMNLQDALAEGVTING